MMYTAKVKYRYGSGKASNSTATTIFTKGMTESAVLEALHKRHSNIKNLVIVIDEIQWKK